MGSGRGDPTSRMDPPCAGQTGSGLEGDSSDRHRVISRDALERHTGCRYAARPLRARPTHAPVDPWLSMVLALQGAIRAIETDDQLSIITGWQNLEELRARFAPY